MAPKQRQGYGGYGSNAVKAEATPAPEFSAKFAPAVEHFPIKEAAAPPPVAVGTTDSTKPDQASSHTNEELIFSAAFAPAVAHFPIKEAAAPPPVAIGTRDSTKLDRASSDCGMLQIQNEELDAIGLYLNASKTKILTTIALHGISAAPPPVAIGSTDSTKPDRASSDANEQLIASLVRWNKLQAAEARTIQAVEQATIAAEAIHEAEKPRHRMRGNPSRHSLAAQQAGAAAESKIKAWQAAAKTVESQAAAKAAEQRAKTAEAAAAAAAESKIKAWQAAAQAAEKRAKTTEAAAAAAWASILQASQAATKAAEQRAKTAEAAANAAESKIQA